MKNIKFVVLILGVFLSMAIYVFNEKIKNHFMNSAEIIEELNKLKEMEYKLDYDVLRSSVFFYFDNDIIVGDIKKIKFIISSLEKNKVFKKDYKNTYEEFLKYKTKMYHKIDDVYHFQTVNMPIKNSLLYLGSLSEKMLKSDKKIGEKVVSLVLSIYQAKNTLDNALIENKNLLTIEKSNIKYKKAFFNHFKVFSDYFPIYTQLLRKILKPSNIDIVISKHFAKNSYYIKVFSFLSLLLLGFVILAVLIVVYLFHKLDVLYKTDTLTGLFNRYKLNEDINNFSKPVLIIFNIDKFKSYNDVFGTKIGDEILKEVARRLDNLAKYGKVYRLGADDFAVLCEKDNCIAENFAQKVVEYFKTHPLKIDELEFDISFSVGISDKKPLLETADMVLKSIKKDVNIRIKKYSPELNLEKEVKENLAKVSILREAIEKGNIVPVFQPIIDIKTDKIEKYEVLARVKRDTLESIFPYLKVARDNKLYDYISEAIFKQAFKVIEEKKINLSLNVSIDDLANKSFMKLVYDNLSKYAQYLTFEILESDAIEDYSLLEEFIAEVKRYGAKISIDDFGSGYSNFARILSLNVDYIKIDGSLIKNIDHDSQSKLITEMIVDFCKKTNIKTVAEYVHNEKVLEVVKEMGIDYGQGFYLGKPDFLE